MEKGKLAWKISVAGSEGVGKSSLISRIIYNTDKVQGSHRSLQKKTLRLESNGGIISVDLLLQEIDITKNEERFIAGSNAVLVLTDITDPASLASADQFLRYLESQDSARIVRLLVTKLDRKYEAKFWDEELSQVSKKYDVDYTKLSSRTGDGFEPFFESLKQELLERYYEGKKIVR